MDTSFFTILQAALSLITIIRAIECIILASSAREHPNTKLDSLIMLTVSVILLLLSKIVEELCSGTILTQKINVDYVIIQ